MTIKQLTEIVNGSLTPSNQKLDAELIEISSTASNAIQVSEDGILVDVSQLATKTELASAIAGIGNSTPQTGWTLTNATIVNGVLTYTGGTYEEEGVSEQTQIGLFAQRKLKIGESVTVDFKVNTSQISSITLSVDHGLGSKTGQWGDIGATIHQNGLKSFLYEGRGLPIENNLNEGATYKAKITRVENDKVVLEFLDSDETIIATREVFIEGLSLGRIWFTVKMVDPAVSYSTNIVVTPPAYATKIELQEVLTTLGVTTPSEWELTNAYILNNYLTYISDGNPSGALYARKSLGIGESVTIDFEFDTNRISGLMFAADDGTSVEGSYSSESAVILQDLTSAILIAQQDWNSDYKVYLNDSTSYKATILRLAKSRVVLSISDVEGNLLISRDVTVGTADINRVWLHVSLYGNPGDTISYGTNITATPGTFASSASLDFKVDKEVGKTLTSNDYTDEDKTKLSNILPYEISGVVGSPTSVYREDLADRTVFTVNTVNVEGQMNTHNPSYINSPKVNSVPLYSLNNEGEYVLTEPDSWVSFNQSSYVFPVYHLSTVDDSYVKGIVNFSIQLMEDHLRVNYEHNVKSIIDDYSLQAQSSLLRLRNEYLPLTFTSSLNGELVYGIFDVPLSTLADGESVQSLLDWMLSVGTKPIFEFSLKSIRKETVKVSQTLSMGGSQS